MQEVRTVGARGAHLNAVAEHVEQCQAAVFVAIRGVAVAAGYPPVMPRLCLEGMDHHDARDPDNAEGSCGGAERAMGNVALDARRLAGQSPNAPIENITPGKARGSDKRRSLPERSYREYCRREHERVVTCRDVISSDLGLVSEIVRETFECREPEQRARQEPQQRQPERITSPDMHTFVGEYSHELLN